MNNHQIEHILRPLLGDAFGGVYPSDMIPQINRRPTFLVVNTHDRNREGEHWIAIIIEAEDNNVSFFDSFGNPPNFVHYPRSFVKILSQYGTEIRYNRNQVQDELSSTCGAHVIFFLSQRFKGLSFPEVMRLYSDNLKKNDVLVTSFVKKYKKCINRLRADRLNTQNACSLKLFNDCYNCMNKK